MGGGPASDKLDDVGTVTMGSQASDPRLKQWSPEAQKDVGDGKRDTADAEAEREKEREEHLLIVLPFPTPTEQIERLHRKHPRIRITYLENTYAVSPWLHDAVPPGEILIFLIHGWGDFLKTITDISFGEKGCSLGGDTECMG